MKLALFLLSLSIGWISCGNAQKSGQSDIASQSKPDSMANPGVLEYLGVYGPLTVGEDAFHLSWSSHPMENYWKQEYIPKNDDIERYIQMVMVELLVGNTKPKEAMQQKINELESMKGQDPLIKYTVSTDPKTGDDVLEFMISENEASGNGIVEWNVYRYVPYKGLNDEKGFQLFGYSRRGYDVKTQSFIDEISSDGAKFKNNFMALPVPTINLKK